MSNFFSFLLYKAGCTLKADSFYKQQQVKWQTWIFHLTIVPDVLVPATPAVLRPGHVVCHVLVLLDVRTRTPFQAECCLGLVVTTLEWVLARSLTLLTQLSADLRWTLLAKSRC